MPEVEIPAFTQQVSEQPLSPLGAPAVPATTETPAEATEREGQKTAAQETAGEEGGTPEKKTTDADSGEKLDEKQARKGQSRFDRKIDRLNRQLGEERARAEHLARQIEELKPKEVSPEGAPRLEDFDDIEKYAQAKADFQVKRFQDETQAKNRAEMQKQMIGRIASEWETKSARAETKYDDFDEVVGNLQPESPFHIAIMECDNAEDVAYYLGKNPKEALELARLHPLAMARKIGKLEAKLAAEPPKSQTPSKAPAPIVPVSGKASPANDMPSDKDDINTWIRKENARGLRARNGG